MIFTPYPDEMERIRLIQKYNGADYSLLRLTFTMIDKNNLDANGLFRDMLFNAGLVDYDCLEHGGNKGKVIPSTLILPDKTEKVQLKFYRVSNARGDRRFSIETIKQKAANRVLTEGDLLYFAALNKEHGAEIVIINLTRNTPTEKDLRLHLGVDDVYEALNELRPKLARIIHSGYHNNSKGSGAIAPKDVGDTLESLLDIPTNNRGNADYNGKIEIKAKSGKTLDTLFTLRPRFENTPIEAYESDDRKRVSAFARYYGYDSDKHPGSKSLYITIGSESSPQNMQGFYLEVNDENRRVELRRKDGKNPKSTVTAHWTFSELKQELFQKHPATLWVTATSRMNDGIGQFKYEQIFFSRAPQFTTFLSLIKEGVVTYDWRGYTSCDGSYTGKNHGNAWRIKAKRKADLFGEMEPLQLQELSKVDHVSR